MNKYDYGTVENKAFLDSVRDSLFDFGRRFPSPGGGSYYLGDAGEPWTDRPRETWITSRMAHVYSLEYLLHGKADEQAASLIDAALRGLNGELKDHVNGGWYPGRYANGTILPDKQCYAHAFVILAASSAYLCGRPGAKELLDEALATYDRFFWNEEEGLACDTWNTEFTELSDYRGVNANMHTVEAFLAVADVLQDESYRVRAGRVISHVREWAAGNSWRIPEHFTKDWVPDLECNADKKDDPFKPYGATPGHGIEWARLITQWALSSVKSGVLSEAECAQAISDAEHLYRTAVTDGWNADGGRGIVYTTDWQGQPVVHDRMHWTLAEAINTSSVLYRVTGKEEYASDFAAFLQYLDEVVLDHKNGSWFHQMDKNGNVMTTVWPGKSDLYHAVQSMMIPYAKVDVSIAPATAAAVSTATGASGSAAKTNS